MWGHRLRDGVGVRARSQRCHVDDPVRGDRDERGRIRDRNLAGDSRRRRFSGSAQLLAGDPDPRLLLQSERTAREQLGHGGLRRAQLTISNQQIVAPQSTNAVAYWSASTFGPNVEAYVTFRANSSAQLYARISNPGTPQLKGYAVKFLAT